MSRTNLSPLIKAQVEKLIVAGGGNPLIISKKSIHPNIASSYTCIPDQMSILDETVLQSCQEFDDDARYTSLPMFSSNTYQQLEHSAARDRIAVKNKRRQQPIKEKSSILREIDGKQNDLFSSIINDDEQISSIELTNEIQQPIIDLSDLNIIRSRLRDHSADNIISSKPIIPTYISAIQRSRSFKRPQEINSTKLIINDDEEEEEEEENKKSIKEHIYDNLDLFKTKSNLSSTDNNVKSRDNLIPTTTRLRPVTMYIPENNDEKISNEFENVFNQLKNRNTNKKEPISISEESKQQSSIIIPLEETNQNEYESNVISTNKIIEISPINRRRTVSGVNLMGNNKVAIENNKPIPSWVDIAKQKQSKFQSVSNEKTNLSEEQVIISTNTENTLDDIQSNIKCRFEPIIKRRVSPPSTTHIIERDSIRALKAGNPNRINNLIQLFDK